MNEQLSGLIVGKILAMFGKRKEDEIDSEEIETDYLITFYTHRVVHKC